MQMLLIEVSDVIYDYDWDVFVYAGQQQNL